MPTQKDRFIAHKSRELAPKGGQRVCPKHSDSQPEASEKVQRLRDMWARR